MVIAVGRVEIITVATINGKLIAVGYIRLVG